MGNPVVGFLLFAGLFWASKQVPFHIPQVFVGMRIAYVLSTILVLLIYSYTKGSIDGSREKTVVVCAEPSKRGNDDKTTSISVRDYDLKQWKTLVKGFCMSLFMMAGMHLYLGMPGPLLINTIVPLKTALESELVQIHLFGKAVQRPFPEPKNMVSMFAAARNKVWTSENKKGGLKQQ